MRVVVLQSNYLPWKGYFDLIHDANIFIFYDEVQYTKNDWRNRNRIYSKNGLQWLTVPIGKDAVKQKISEVKLQDHHWQQLHFDTLYFAYKRAPYFSQLEELMIDFFRIHDWSFLSQLNQYTIKKISNFLGIETRFLNSADFDLKETRVERLVDLLVQVGATRYISGPAGRGYLSERENLFFEKGIEITYKDYDGFPPYTQLSTPFENYVSIVDLLANVSRDEICNYVWKWRQA